MKHKQVIATLHTIAFTHRNLSVNEVGEFHIDEELQQGRLSRLKKNCCIDELMFLSTCNRVEFVIVFPGEMSFKFLTGFF